VPEPQSFTIHDRIATILTRYVSPILAEGLLTRALRECRLTPAAVCGENVIQLYAKLEASVRLFVDAPVVELIWVDLDELASEFHPKAPVTIALASEHDIAEARAQTRLFCQRMRAQPMAAERVVAVVSELARNIVSHTPGGQIELCGEGAPVTKIRIAATDRGAGIPNLAEVLAGKVRPHGALGKGITGVKRIADQFAIQSSESGTRVDVEVDC
jgi:serine/threonine-protein kinase RsbT